MAFFAHIQPVLGNMRIGVQLREGRNRVRREKIGKDGVRLLVSGAKIYEPGSDDKKLRGERISS